MKRGDVFFCEDFQFADGELGDKLFVILNNATAEKPFIAVLTTSKQKDRYDRPGCYADNGYFFIAPNTEGFPLPTWIKFNQIYPFTYAEGTEKEKKGRFRFRYCIREERMNEIIKCIKNTFDITKEQISYL